MAGRTRRIVAIGGAGMGAASTDGPLLRHLLDLTGRDRPRVCHIGAADGENAQSRAEFYHWFARRAEATHLDLFARWVDDIGAFLLDQDLVYVGGGNTANLLAIWRVHGVDVALRGAWDAGVVLAGHSAGGICWFEGGLADSFGPGLGPVHGLEFLEGSFCPHYDSESLRRPRYAEVVGTGELPDGYAADDGVGLVFEDRRLLEAVASLPGQHGYRVERRRGNDVEEQQIRARLLR